MEKKARKTDLNVLSLSDIAAPNGSVNSPADFAVYALANTFDIKKLPPQDDGLLYLKGNLIGSRGNFITIMGRAKSRKTVVASALATSFFLTSGYLGFESEIKEGEKILHIDSEQGYFHYYHSVSRIFHNADMEAPPSNFVSVRSRDADVKFRVGLLTYLCELHRPTVVIIDGITDFVEDINDQKEATKIGELLLQLTEKYNACFIVVIHTTKSTGNMTGAVGTTLEKKCQTAIEVELTEDDEANSSNVSCKFSRDKMFSAFTIRYNETKRWYEVVDEQSVTTKGKTGDKAPGNYQEAQHKAILKQIFLLSDKIEKRSLQKKLYKAVSNETKDSLNDRLLKTWEKYYLSQNFIIEGPEEMYILPVMLQEKKVEAPNLFNSQVTNTDDLPF